MSDVRRCESNGCVEVIAHEVGLRWASGDTGTVMQTPYSEAAQLIERIQAGGNFQRNRPQRWGESLR